MNIMHFFTYIYKDTENEGDINLNSRRTDRTLMTYFLDNIKLRQLLRRRSRQDYFEALA